MMVQNRAFGTITACLCRAALGTALGAPVDYKGSARDIRDIPALVSAQGIEPLTVRYVPHGGEISGA
jgi:hypothetical protein